ncbi:tyrosine-type recombinase/integrase [Alicycliphilus denitrificans]|uniref:tyrosine-type recombinase/integrase n=1 Tax=Alicycliphilus denitrificans TaxID=179636 RepID=UPI003A80A474
MTESSSSSSSSPASVSSAKSTGAPRAPSQPYRHGKGWAIRRSYKGYSLFLSGYRSAAGASRAMRHKQQDIDDQQNPAGYGPERTTLAQAMQDYAMERLPFKKGAVQEARRINVYLRSAGLSLLDVQPVPSAKETPSRPAASTYFEVSLMPHQLEREIPKGLGAHRRAQLTANAKTDQLRAALATSPMADISRELIQRLVDQMRKDGNSAATIDLERSALRVLFNHARSHWRWAALCDNPATHLKMPRLDNQRSRVPSDQQLSRLAQELARCRNRQLAPTLALLAETAMRASEPLSHARWKDVNWTERILMLGDSKNGKRAVPLSDGALQALRALSALNGQEPEAPITTATYDALAAAWRRACKRAGLVDLHIHDLRHICATRWARVMPNVLHVMALTGHKTFVSVQRYAHVDAQDVVGIMRNASAICGPLAATLVPAGTSASPASQAAGAAPGAGADASAPEQAMGSNVLAFPQRRRA